MSKRLLSVLFPNFVKKEYSQSQRVSQGPFGEGLEKARTYLKPGEQSPEGANVQTGPQGGKYFDDMGGGGAATQDSSAQGGYDIDYGDPERSAQVREDLDQEGMGVPPAPEAGPEISEDRNVVGGIDYGPAKPEAQNAQDFGEAAKREGTLRWGSSPAAAEALSTGRIVYGGVDYGPSNMEPINLPDTASTDERFDANERQEAQEEADYQTAKEGGYSTTTIGTSLGDVPWYGTGDEGPFPGSDEWYEENREELEAKGKPTSHEELLAANEEEAKRSEGMYPKQTSPQDVDYGPAATPDEAQKPKINQEEFDAAYGRYQDDLVDRATQTPDEMTDTQKMAKMMQEYNVDNKRRDPVILSNKGGSQRRSLQKATSTTAGFKKAGSHKYTSRTMGANGKYVYEYSGGVQGKPDAPAGSSPEQSSAHHHEALRHHGALAAKSEKQAKTLGAQAPDHPMTQQAQATSQGHREAQTYHRDQFDQHQAAGAGYDPEEANRQKQGATYGWD